MPDLTQVEEATGERLEKTDEYTRHRDAMKAQGFAVVHGFKADAMRDELLAAIAAEKQRADQAEYDKSECQDAAYRSNEAAALANADNEQLRARLAAVERERDRLRGAILTHVASAIGDPLETGQAYAAFLARYDAAHPAERGG